MSNATGLVVVGVNHHTAPVEVRERLFLDPESVKRHLTRLRTEFCDEALLVSTCNRVELYAVASENTSERVRGWLNQFHAPEGGSIDRYLFWREGRDAIVHLFRVAGSLDSMVLGEPQILGQVKDAVRLAEESGSLGAVLGNLSRRTLAVAKRVRTETSIGRCRVGIGNAGVDLARQIFGDLKGRKALLLGVGDMGRQVAAALHAEGVSRLCVVNRTFERAQSLASELGPAVAAPWDQLDRELANADIVISAVGGTEPVLDAVRVTRALKARRWDPLFIVDLGVPRNVDAAVASIDEAYLFNVDDLTRVLEQGQAAREVASREAMTIVEHEADQFLTALRVVEVGPLIGRVTRRAEVMRQAELARSRKLLDTMGPAEREQLDLMTKALVKKMLDAPLRQLREAAREGDSARIDQLLASFGAEDEG